MAQKKKIKPVTCSQMNALIKRIVTIKEIRSKFAKKTILFLLDLSKNLSRPIKLSFTNKLAEEGKRVSLTIHNLYSTECNTRLDIFMKAMGTKMQFSSAHGIYTDKGFDNTPEVDGYTIWLAPERYDHSAELLKIDNISYDLKKLIQKTAIPKF